MYTNRIQNIYHHLCIVPKKSFNQTNDPRRKFHLPLDGFSAANSESHLPFPRLAESFFIGLFIVASVREREAPLEGDRNLDLDSQSFCLSLALGSFSSLPRSSGALGLDALGAELLRKLKAAFWRLA